MQKPLRTIIFHTTQSVDHVRVGRLLMHRPDIIYNSYTWYIPYYVKHVDNQNKSIAGKLYANIWGDVWRKMTNNYVLNCSYLPVDINLEHSYIPRDNEVKHPWAIFDTYSAASGTISLPDSVIKIGDIILFQHNITADKAILM